MNKNVTIVTGLWDLGRENLEGWAKRSFEHYKSRFFDLLKTNAQMCIWIPRQLEEEVKKIRENKPTIIYIKEVEDFKTWFPFFDELQNIRTNPDWYSSAGWLKESPQASLEFYNPMMMCKMFMLNDSSILNPFNSEYFFWLDGGITNTVNSGYFTHDNVLDNLDYYCSMNENKILHLSYPYEGNDEIHGFERIKMAEFCDTDFVRYVTRGGFFGGKKEKINKLNGIYYQILSQTINQGYMGADECLFTIICHKHPDMIYRFMLEGNGLCGLFFEDLKNIKKTKKITDVNVKPTNLLDIGLYVITYNSPNQFEKLCISFQEYDRNFLDRPKKFLLNNSIDLSTNERYKELCETYDFIEIKKDNIGICGGRQFIAEHSEENNLDYHFFFEDDMFFYLGEDEFCKNGFRRKIKNFYNTVIDIAKNEDFDYLKWNFTEFFGDNSKQWSWHNVPANVRKELFPDNPEKNNGDINLAPYTKYKNIKSLNSLPYATGEVYYCNWPQVVSKKGNKKMFLDVKWHSPFEQTWMSYLYQETVKNNFNPGILLATPTEHNRFEFYPKEERREN